MNILFKWIKGLSTTDHLSAKTHKNPGQTSLYKEDITLLPAEGMGTICLSLEQLKAFNLDLIASNALLRLSVNHRNIKLYCIYRGRFILLKEDKAHDLGLDSDSDCLYWLSFEARTRTILFGKNKPSAQNASFFFKLPKSNKSPEQYWMNKIAHYRIDIPVVAHLSKAPVKLETSHKAMINLLTSRFETLKTSSVYKDNHE